MTIFLSFGNCVAVQTVLNENLGESIGDLGRIYEVVLRQIEVAVVLEHTCIKNLRIVAALVKAVEAFNVERHRKLDSTVAAEVEEDNTVIIADLADRLAVFSDNERRKILVDSAGLLTKGVVCLSSGSELSALAANMSIPAKLYHVPVSLVSIHSHLHSAAA